MLKAPSQLTKYGAYRASGIDWLGVVPSHWSVKRLKYLFREVNERSNDGLEELLSVSQYSGVTKRSEKCSEGDFISNAESLEGYKKVKEGDLVSNIMLAWNGSLAFSSYSGITSPAYSIYRLSRNHHTGFYNYLLRTEIYRTEYKKRSSGVIDSRLRLYTDDFYDIFSLIPPIIEQKEIARFLDLKSSQIDQAISVKERQIELLKERKQILIQQAVTRGLNPSAPMKDSGVDWIDRIPAHWDVKPIMAVSDVIDPNPSHRNPEYVEEGFPFISTQEFYGFDEIEIDTPRRVSEKTVAEQEARCRFKRGSLVFSRKGTIGAVRVLPEGVRLGILDSLCVINPKGSALPNFLFWSLSANYLEAQYGSTLRGAALPQLSVGRVRSLKIILPPKTEQEEISSYLRRECSRLSECLAIQERQISALKEYKTTLINSAVTGKIKVPGVVEPAENKEREFA